MAFVDELQAIFTQTDARRAAEQSTKPPSAVTLRDRLLTLTGHPGPNGTRWITSVEAAEFAGIRDYRQARSGFRAIHATMTALGWREGRVGAGRIKTRGYLRGEPLKAAELSSHHVTAVTAIRGALDTLVPLGLTDAQLTAAWFDARSEVPVDALDTAEPIASVVTSAAAEPVEPTAPVDRRVRPARPTYTPRAAPPEPPTLAAVLAMLGPPPEPGRRDRRRGMIDAQSEPGGRP